MRKQCRRESGGTGAHGFHNVEHMIDLLSDLLLALRHAQNLGDKGVMPHTLDQKSRKKQ